jgi:hypothetical protein
MCGGLPPLPQPICYSAYLSNFLPFTFYDTFIPKQRNKNGTRCLKINVGNVACHAYAEAKL